ncbi:hypothetical protein WICPIJ_002690 [Wickerhamomyces pijperi]|uniref:Uncharacterized protein n=1 Tax=Wickerhamomyces pijperi TaxID=599730 RepID=A0A9P8TNP9_WICPI|nr:hypothetical protein WICPIJ_002690 [Wickerhamomyces pijperi]
MAVNVDDGDSWGVQIGDVSETNSDCFTIRNGLQDFDQFIQISNILVVDRVQDPAHWLGLLKEERARSVVDEDTLDWDSIDSGHLVTHIVERGTTEL